MKDVELNKFYDKKKNVWEIREKGDAIVMLKNDVETVFFVNTKLGHRLLEMKIKELKK